MKKVVSRMQKSTPRFFRVVRAIGLTLAGVGTAIWTSPVGLPEMVMSIGGYIAVAGGVMSAVSQTAVKNEKE